MQINSQDSINKSSLNISSTSQSDLVFKQGESLKGRVQEIKDNGLITINIKGKLIDAMTTVEVNKGQELYLIVDSIKEGKTILTIASPENSSKMDNSNLSNKLKELNLPADDKNVQMGKKLIQHNLPLTGENLKIMAKGVKFLSGITPKNLEIVGMAMDKGAPITPETLKSLLQFLDGQSNIANLTDETLSILNKMEANMAALTELPAQAEANIQSKPANSVFQLLDQIIESITLPEKQSLESDLADEITQSIKTNLSNEDDLLRGLSLVKEILAQKETPEISKNLKDLLINKLSDMEKELSGQKISNVMTKTSEDKNGNFYYLSFPLKMEGQYRLSELKIKKDGTRKSLGDMDDIKLLVSLDTSKLGLVIFNVEWNKAKSIKIEGLVEKEISLEYIDSNFNKLIEKLESYDYLVEYNGIKVSKDAREEMRLKIEEKAEVVGPFEIDLLV